MTEELMIGRHHLNAETWSYKLQKCQHWDDRKCQQALQRTNQARTKMLSH
jgi:hypothetical protein